MIKQFKPRPALYIDKECSKDEFLLMSIKLIDNIEVGLKLSIDDVIHVVRELRKDVDDLKTEIKTLKNKRSKEND